MMAQVLVISDDLSGGNSVGLEFANLGFQTYLIQKLTGSVTNHDCEVLVFDTETRLVAGEQAYETVRSAAKKLDALITIKKIDSLLRGSIGLEIKAIMDEKKFPHAVVLPASPLAGRTTVNGFQLVNGKLLAEAKGADPSSIVAESHVPTLLSQVFENKVGLLPLHIILKGKDAVLVGLAELMRTSSIIVSDATTQEHMNVVLSAAYSLGVRLFAGTYGIGESVGNLLQTRPSTRKPILAIAGSLSEVTRKQVAFAEKDPHLKVVSIALPKKLSDWDSEKIIESYRNDILHQIHNGFDVLVYNASNKKDLYSSLLDPKHIGISQKDIDERVSGIIQQLVQPAIQYVSGVIATGGATAHAVFQLLNGSGLDILPSEVVPSVPASRVVSGPFKGLLFLTKPGAYGDEMAIQQMVSYARLQHSINLIPSSTSFLEA